MLFAPGFGGSLTRGRLWCGASSVSYTHLDVYKRQACGRPGALAIEALYAKSDGANRESLLEVLAQMPADHVSPELIQKALKDPEGSVRAAAVAAVAAWQLPNGVALLKPLCKDGDRLVLAAVATALGDFSSKTAKSLLESMNAGGDWAIDCLLYTSRCV